METKYLISQNKYGWCLRLDGWNGPNLATRDTLEQVIDLAKNGERGIDYSIHPGAAFVVETGKPAYIVSP